MTQKAIIEQHLTRFGVVSSWEAFKDYGITRLADIVYKLRNKKEMAIGRINCTRKNRFGNPVTFAVYYYGIDQEQAQKIVNENYK